MKRMFLALLAVAAMVACEKENKIENKDNIDIQSKYEFVFDENGVCYCKDNEGITQKEFAENIVGFGWRICNRQHINEDGSLWSNNLPTDGSEQYIFFTSTESMSVFTTVLSWDENRLVSYDTTFDDSLIYIGEKDNYRVLEVTDSKMVLISTTYNGNITSYNLHEYERISMERMTQIIESYMPTESEYELAFDENGVCYSKTYEGITQEEFDSKVMSYGWEMTSSNRVQKDGRLLTDSYYFEIDGIGYESLYFGKEGVLTSFYESSAVAPEQGDKGFQETAYTYENSRIYHDWCKPSYYYMILEVSEDELVLLMCRDRARESNDWTYTYTLNRYNRMTPEQLEEYQQTYTRKWGEE